jgi:hypothetical protein
VSKIPKEELKVEGKNSLTPQLTRENAEHIVITNNLGNEKILENQKENLEPQSINDELLNNIKEAPGKTRRVIGEMKSKTPNQ